MKAYTSNVVLLTYSLTHSLTHSSVRIMLVYPIWSQVPFFFTIFKFFLGLNLTLPMSDVVLEHANITLNRGYGVYMNSSRGSLMLRYNGILNYTEAAIKLWKRA